MNTYRIEVKVTNDSQWCGNAKTYKTKKAAIDAARDLFFRWLSTTNWRVIHNEKGGQVVDAEGP